MKKENYVFTETTTYFTVHISLAFDIRKKKITQTNTFSWFGNNAIELNTKLIANYFGWPLL